MAAANLVKRLRPVRLPVMAWRHRGLRESDAFLASYPKSGNTWVKFMLAHLAAGEEIDFDTDERLVPPVGRQGSARAILPGEGRLVKTHEPYNRAWVRRPQRSVYILRDGRDVAVSYYYAHLRRGWFEGGFSDFLPLFLAGRLDGYRPWHVHVRSWLESPLAGTGRMLVVRYESVLADPAAELRRLAEFLRLPTDGDRVRVAVESATIDRMRERERGSQLEKLTRRPDISVVRKGVAGDWASVFRAEDHERFLAVAGDVLVELGYASRVSDAG